MLSRLTLITARVRSPFAEVSRLWPASWETAAGRWLTEARRRTRPLVESREAAVAVGLWRNGARVGPVRVTRDRAGAGLLALVAVTVVVLATSVLSGARQGAAPDGAGSAVVQRGVVTATVAGEGRAERAGPMALGFGVPGELTEVDVRAGDTVRWGQPLARIDQGPFQAAVDQADAALRQARLALAATQNGTAATQAQQDLAAAQRAVADSQAQATAATAADQAAVASDQAQLAADQGASNGAAAAFAADQAAVNTGQARVNQDQAALQAGRCNALLLVPANCAALRAREQADQAALAQAQARLQADQGGQAKVLVDQQRLAADQARQGADAATAQGGSYDAQAAVADAQVRLAAQTTGRDTTLAAEETAVTGAGDADRAARRDLDSTSLDAPFDGVVTSVSGVPGDSVVPVQQGGNANLVVLNSTVPLEVVATLAGVDDRLAPGQTGSVTFDALPGLALPAHVVGVATLADPAAGGPGARMTLALDQFDARLREGMSGAVSVTVSQVGDVLVVPNRAVTRVGAVTYVDVVGRGPGPARRAAVRTAAVGDTTTEVVLGLNPGDQVRVAPLRPPAG